MTRTKIQQLLNDTSYLDKMKSILDIDQVALSRAFYTKALGMNKSYFDIESDIGLNSVQSNKDIIVDIQLIEGDELPYYVVYTPGEPIDFEHWESVEKLFQEYNFTGNWLGDELTRPKSTYIRWVDDLDDELEYTAKYPEMSFDLAKISKGIAKYDYKV